jgi:glycosyltransferase involved in cell wall biosynthesis
LSLGPFSSALSPADSALAFRITLAGGRPTALTVARLILKSHIKWWTGSRVRGNVLFNTSNVWLKVSRYANALRRAGAWPVVFVHDILPLTYPEYFRPDEDRKHLARMRTALRIGKGIIVNSQDTLNSLRQFATSENLPLPPAVVAPLGQSLSRVPAGPRPIDAPYFVILGTIEPRKNHLLLLQLWRKLVDRHGGASPRLVVIGMRGWECENVVDLLERSPRLRGAVIERNRCEDREVATWLTHARALLFPSFAEGYGMPINEALSLGLPVIASRLPVFEEVAGDVPEYIDALDGERWLEVIEDYAAERSALRDAQLERMKQFRPATWEGHFDTVDAFLATLN